MKRKIRYGIFETNSSSTHTITIGNAAKKLISIFNKGYYEFDEETGESDFIRPDNYIHMSFGDFGWGPEIINDVYRKIQYALTMVIETEGNHGEIKSLEDYYNTKGFKAINELVKKECGSDGIIIYNDDENEIRFESYSSDDPNKGYIVHEGYIDHDSCDFKSLQDFLDHYNISLHDFLFDSNVTLIIDGEG